MSLMITHWFLRNGNARDGGVGHFSLRSGDCSQVPFEIGTGTPNARATLLRLLPGPVSPMKLAVYRQDEDQIFVMIIMLRMASHSQFSAAEQHSDHYHDSDERPATIMAVDKEGTVSPTCVLIGRSRLNEIPDEIVVSMDLGHEEYRNRPLTFKGE